jgi:hypothetical protein|nr:MAG TPA: hypothetical protein [Caudoviricetes sp.]
MQKVSILGTTYSVHTGVSYQEDATLKGLFGYCSHIKRKIVVGDLLTCDGWSNEREEDLKAQERLTLRHEIIHAFLNESGLTSSSNGVDCWAKKMKKWLTGLLFNIRRLKRYFSS